MSLDEEEVTEPVTKIVIVGVLVPSGGVVWPNWASDALVAAFPGWQRSEGWPGTQRIFEAIADAQPDQSKESGTSG